MDSLLLQEIFFYGAAVGLHHAVIAFISPNHNVLNKMYTWVTVTNSSNTEGRGPGTAQALDSY